MSRPTCAERRLALVAARHRRSAAAAAAPKVQRPGAALEQARQLAAGGADAAGQRDAREEGRPRRADVGVGRDQLLLGLAHVGPARQHVGRQAGRHVRQRQALPARSSPAIVGRHRLRRAAAPARSASSARWRCCCASATRARFGQRLAPGGSPAPTRRRCRSAAWSARSDSSRVASVCARQRQQFLVGHQAEPGVGDRGDQADLRRLAAFLGGQVLRQRRFAQAGDAAERSISQARERQARRCRRWCCRRCRCAGRARNR